MVRTPSFHCRGHGFDPWWGTKIPQAAQPIKKGGALIINNKRCFHHLESPRVFFFLFLLFFFWPHCEACGILVPRPGIEPGPSPSAVKAPSPNHWTAMEFPGKSKCV